MTKRHPSPRRRLEAPEDSDVSFDRGLIPGRLICSGAQGCGCVFKSTSNQVVCPNCGGVGYPLDMFGIATGMDGREDWRDDDELSDDADADPFTDDEE